ncbi:hypothetical protein WQ59_18580 [Streptomyces sp. KE1]|nr:hypothetical protein WQ59_18580 [Streptomyces sp. KE1]
MGVAPVAEEDLDGGAVDEDAQPDRARRSRSSATAAFSLAGSPVESTVRTRCPWPQAVSMAPRSSAPANGEEAMWSVTSPITAVRLRRRPRATALGR